MNGLVDYIAARYKSAAEIGIGHFPDVALSLTKKGLRIFATDIYPFAYDGLRVIVDDITKPDTALYKGIDLIYSLRPPMEFLPYMKRLAAILSADVVVKPLSSDYLDGKLIAHRNSRFYVWTNGSYK
ncbi:MAG: UPF0146 family protein [Nitrospirota bacterium]